MQYLCFRLDLQEGLFTELLAVQHEELTNEDLVESEFQRKDKERQEGQDEDEEVTEEPKRFRMQEMARFSFSEEALLVFETRELRTVQEGCRSCSECNPALLHHPW